MKLARTSLVLLVIQLALVSSIAMKYLYQRETCPRVWTRAVAYDPQLVMRGRYLSLQLTVDACGSTLPVSRYTPGQYADLSGNGRFPINDPSVSFHASLKVENNKLVAIRLPEQDGRSSANLVMVPPGASCDALRLQQPVDFYIAEHAADPTRIKPGEELWIEVTIPPKGPPRPIQLALKQDGAWKPLAFQ